MVKEESERSEIKLAFNCLECGKTFIVWHDGEGLVTTICPKCHTIHNTTGFWNSYPIEDLSPEQRKHFKTIMRKEVRK